MTVGIAASGPRAGAGVLAGLRAIEAVGSGAIGGFVTLAVLTRNDDLLRWETQSGGSQGLFPDGVPASVQSAHCAALISSGPNRPAPLSQFVAAAPGVGLVTGHRFPQARVGDGLALNARVLRAMADGMTPKAAVQKVIDAFPECDAGFLALSSMGEIGLGNMPSVLKRSDQGAALKTVQNPTASVATIHNAIYPHRFLAALVNDMMLDEMLYRDAPQHKIAVRAGLDLAHGKAAEIHVDASLRALRILHPLAPQLGENQTIGLGDQVCVFCDGRPLGWLGYEPFITMKGGKILDMDGAENMELPVVARRRFDI